MQNLSNNSGVSSFIARRAAEIRESSYIDVGLFNEYGVKRGLRNSDGTGVLAGITRIGNVRGYYVQDGERVPMPGQLIFRGYDVDKLVSGFLSEGRFGFEEIAYLILFGDLPNTE